MRIFGRLTQMKWFFSDFTMGISFVLKKYGIFSLFLYICNRISKFLKTHEYFRT